MLFTMALDERTWEDVEQVFIDYHSSKLWLFHCDDINYKLMERDAKILFKRCARSAGPYLVASNLKPSITSVASQILPLAKCYHEAKIDLRVVLSLQTGPKSSPKVLGSTPKGST